MTQVREAGIAGALRASIPGPAAGFGRLPAIALTAVLLAACGGGGSTDEAGTSGTTDGTDGGTTGGTGGTGTGGATRVPQWLVFTADKGVDER